MKVLLRSSSGYGAWFGLRLENEGHSVAYCLDDSRYKLVLEGMLEKTITKPSDPDLVIFDMSGFGSETTKYECPVLGDSLLADKLEDDRLFGLDTMKAAGIKVAPYEAFDSISKARSFVGKTHKRYVFKPCGDEDTATTYVSSGPDDLLSYFDRLEALTKGSKFILQEFISGIEVSTEGWFLNGKWYFINHTLEEKKFMNDNKGCNTGCSGNLIWCGSSSSGLFRSTLNNMTSFLLDNGYYGMIDINSIVTPNGVYGLEWTPRFGYDATATQTAFMPDGFGSFLESFFSESLNTSAALNKNGFASSVRLSIAPYPYEDKGNIYQEGVPISGIKDVDSCYLYDVRYLENKKELETAGVSGFIAAPFCLGNSLTESFEKLDSYVQKIKIPNLQYRTDIKEKTSKRYHQLREAGWITS